MAHYIDADRLRAEIEKQKQIHFNDYFVKKSGNPADYGASNALAQVLPLIDSLQQEQPEVDLDAIVNEAFDKYSSVDGYGQLVVSFNRAELYSFIKKIARKEE